METERNELPNFTLIVLILFIFQSLDFVIPIANKEFWFPFLIRGLIDGFVFLLIYYLLVIRFRDYSKITYRVLLLQAFCVLVHLFCYSREYSCLDLFCTDKQIDDWYTSYIYALRAILCLKMAVLGVGGYGVISRFKRDVDRDYPRAIAVSPYFNNAGRNMEKD